MSGPDLSDYVEIPDRIREFFEKYPEGSLQCGAVEYRDLPAAHKNGEPCLHIIYHALAYRNPDDKRPGHGKASEPLPGLTSFTRGSELMNAETSAWGRALVALGFVSKKVASANEVRARMDVPERGANAYGGSDYVEVPARTPNVDIPASEAQVKLVKTLATKAKATVPQLNVMLASVGVEGTAEAGWTSRLTGGRDGTASALISWFKGSPLPDPDHPSDVSADTSDFEQAPLDAEGQALLPETLGS